MCGLRNLVKMSRFYDKVNFDNEIKILDLMSCKIF